VGGSGALQLIDLSGNAPASASAPATLLLLDRSALELSLGEQLSLHSGPASSAATAPGITLRLLSAERLATGQLRFLVYASGAPDASALESAETLQADAWQPVPEQNIKGQGDRLLEVTLPDQRNLLAVARRRAQDQPALNPPTE